MKGILGGPVHAVNTISSRRQDSQPKRPAQTSVPPAEPTRSSKRQKTNVERENSPANDFTKGRFVLGPSPPPAAANLTAPPTTDRQPSSVVDLTESQISEDGETINRSIRETSISSRVSEYFHVERTNAPSGNKRPRRRKIQKPKTPIALDNDDEDDLAKEQPDWPANGTRAPKQTATRFGKARKPTPEGISDSELDELANMTSSTRKRHHSLTGEEADDEKTSPSTSSRRQERANISRVNFSNKKQKLDEVDLKLNRAVCGEKTADFSGLDPTQQPSLRRDSNPNCLVLVDVNNRRLQDYEWVEVKLNFCSEIQYAAAMAPVAYIRRSSGPPLVLEFAKIGDSLAFGLWAEKRLSSISSLPVKARPSDAYVCQ